MQDSIPVWADAQPWARLPQALAAGEGQTIEFKESVPRNASDLAKELAAFGSTDGGFLYLGVTDEGGVIGVPLGSAKARDELLMRVRGIIAGIEPALRYEIGFAVERTSAVLVVHVPREQDEPLYYSNQRACVREGSITRPPSPQEVKESIWRHLSSEGKRQHEQIMLDGMRGAADQTKATREINEEMDRRFLERKYPKR